MFVEKNRPLSLNELLRKTSTICSLPLFYDRLNEAINHPRSSLADIGKIISEDQGLSTRLLRLANSPIFGYHARIDSITRALTLIGTQQLRDLALSISIMGTFKDIPEDLLSMQSFWKHSIACGIFSRNLAMLRREVNPERFFLAGMLHDLGLLVIATVMPQLSKTLLQERQDQQQLLSLVEQQTLGYDHATVGGALLEMWKIPLNLSEPVACHHNPDAALKYALEAAIIHIADIFCHAFELGAAPGWPVPILNKPAWQRLDIRLAQLEPLLDQSFEQIDETLAILTEAP
ncbi:MAG: HDOD domain-containing protein [Deltaproteobacteria bacterium]|nr:HDOD domain-containing protein [Deltaproteobacteria bacterium]NCP03433.1 HDOD domain-containing protein [Deltaproteobacteria bacterium]NCP78278.1 HDOD domain-containing protein [Desulfuromonadales bacterium]